MQLIQSAIAGTLESSDVQISIEPRNKPGIDLSIHSIVLNQYGKQIRQIVLETLARLDVDGVRVDVVDRGALDCTIKARVECAVFRAADIHQNIPWGGVIS